MPFAEFPLDRISELLQLLTNRVPSSASQLYNCVQLFLKSKEIKYSENEFTFYWFNELPLQSTAFLSRRKRKDWSGKAYWIFLGPSSETELPQVISALEELVDWRDLNSFNAVDEGYVSNLRSMCLKHVPHPFPNSTRDAVYWMKKEVALQLSTEQGNAIGEVRELSLEDVDLVMKYWKFASDEEVGLVRFGIEVMGSGGLWVEGNLVSWAVGMPDGAMHALYTVEEERGKGYGRIVTKFICKLLAQRGFYPVAHVEEFNQVSSSLLTSLGFEFSHHMRWTDTDPDVT